MTSVNPGHFSVASISYIEGKKAHSGQRRKEESNDALNPVVVLVPVYTFTTDWL